MKHIVLKWRSEVGDEGDGAIVHTGSKARELKWSCCTITWRSEQFAVQNNDLCADDLIQLEFLC